MSTVNPAIVKYKDTNGNWVAVSSFKGAKGDAATITVGTTTTGAAGTQASVTNTGTSTDAILNFTIPKGADGSCASPVWGNITGSLSNQTDLQTALNAKQNTLTAGTGISIVDNVISVSFGNAESESY